MVREWNIYISFELIANSWSDVHRGHCFYNHYFSRSNLVLHLEPPFLSDVLWVSLIMSDSIIIFREVTLSYTLNSLFYLMYYEWLLFLCQRALFL